MGTFGVGEMLASGGGFSLESMFASEDMVTVGV